MADGLELGGVLLSTPNKTGQYHWLGVYVGQPVDSTTGAIETIDYSHHEIHSGSHYFAVYSALKDNAGTIEVRIATPNTTKWAHMRIVVDSGLAATAQLWMNTTKTHVADNAITPMNRNHNSDNTSGLTICHTPGGAEAAAAALTQYIGAATVSGKAAAGGNATNEAEFILKQNTAYLIRGTSRADGNSLSIILDWYEHTNI